MYGKIGDMRRIEIIVSKDGKEVYSGEVKDAPEEIKESPLLGLLVSTQGFGRFVSVKESK